MVSTVTVDHVRETRGLCGAKKLWQKKTIHVTVVNVEVTNALMLLQSDSQDHGTTDNALHPPYML